MRNKWLAVIFGLLFSAQSFALTVDSPLPDMAQEARAKALFYDIRCVVCEGQAIADSNAEVAADMRRVIRQHIADGESDDAIKAYLVSRYGERVLMSPPVDNNTLLLWFGPLFILFCALLVAFKYFKHHPPYPHECLEEDEEIEP